MSDLLKSVFEFINEPFSLFLSGALLGLLILFFSSFIPSLFSKNVNELRLGLYKFIISAFVLIFVAMIFAIMSYFHQSTVFLTGILISAILFSLLFEMKTTFLKTILKSFNAFKIVPEPIKENIEKEREESKEEISKESMEKDLLKLLRK